MTSTPGWAARTAVTMPRSADPPVSEGEFRWIERFDRTTRIVHWVLAGLVLFLAGTGGVLYIDSWAVAVGRRHLVRDLHVLAGALVPVVVLGGAVGRRAGHYRADLRQLDRWAPAELRALAPWRRPVGESKFSPLQRLFAAFAGGSLAILVLTGAALHWFRFIPLSWRTGATLVHDLAAAGLAAVVVVHIVMALVHPAALRGMVRGWVTVSWARVHHPGWCARVVRMRAWTPRAVDDTPAPGP